MKRLFAVIGLGRFGYSVAESLVKKGCEVLAIDSEESKIQAISDIATFAVQCNATDEGALKAVSAQNVDIAVVAIGENIEASILIVQTLTEMGGTEGIGVTFLEETFGSPTANPKHRLYQGGARKVLKALLPRLRRIGQALVR